ncbi:MAG: ATP-binding protein [Tepidisphaeraceae bacterium]|jgi:signal transduction histidine kinase
MSELATHDPAFVRQRMDELGKMILAYSALTEKLQLSHDKLAKTVRDLQTELSEKNRQLERRKRLAALGEMAAGMAHEIRNPLGGIQLYVSLLLKDLADRPESAAVMQKIAGGVRRLENVVSQVLTFSRDLRPQVAATDLGSVVREALELARPSLGDGVVVTVQAPVTMEVEIDRHLMGQAVLNLVRNAGEAMGGRGELRISFGPPREGYEAKQFFLLVEDTGPGIPPHVMERIFNPFFTTRDHGTGLGLAIVHRIVEAHDGSITASNREGTGARFEIRI